VVSLREEALDRVRNAPVQTLPEALTYCGTVDYLNARAELHEQLNAHAVQVLDVRPSGLSTELLSRYLSWKRSGVF
jgi:uncharacterized protein (DUF58 family)